MRLWYTNAMKIALERKSSVIFFSIKLKKISPDIICIQYQTDNNYDH